VSGRWLRTHLLPVAAGFAAPVLYALWIGHAYPGDEVVTDADSGATMATTLPACC
jgi:hypothetical protein